jgi:hypothetical protein
LFTFVEEVAEALTAFKCPVVVLMAWLLNADTLACKGVELLCLVVALSHLVATRAVDISIVFMTPDELAIGTEDQGPCDAVDTRFQLSQNYCHLVLYFSQREAFT